MIPHSYVAWAERISLIAGIAGLGGCLSYIGPAPWHASRSLSVPLQVAPAWAWAGVLIAGGLLVISGAIGRHGEIRAIGHLLLALVYLLLFCCLLVAWMITGAQWVSHRPMDATMLSAGGAPFLPLLALTVHAGCAVWFKPRRSEPPG